MTKHFEGTATQQMIKYYREIEKKKMVLLSIILVCVSLFFLDFFFNLNFIAWWNSMCTYVVEDLGFFFSIVHHCSFFLVLLVTKNNHTHSHLLLLFVSLLVCVHVCKVVRTIVFRIYFDFFQFYWHFLSHFGISGEMHRCLPIKLCLRNKWIRKI